MATAPGVRPGSRWLLGVALPRWSPRCDLRAPGPCPGGPGSGRVGTRPDCRKAHGSGVTGARAEQPRSGRTAVPGTWGQRGGSPWVAPTQAAEGVLRTPGHCRGGAARPRARTAVPASRRLPRGKGPLLPWRQARSVAPRGAPCRPAQCHLLLWLRLSRLRWPQT